MSLMTNMHVCGLTCEEYVGYQAWLADPVPGTSWARLRRRAGHLGRPAARPHGPAAAVPRADRHLVLVARRRRWATGFRVRWRKGRYSRDYDLHQVAGMIAVPLLLIWAFTGMGFEFGFVEKAWYGALPGEPGPERVLESAECVRARTSARPPRSPPRRRRRGPTRRRPPSTCPLPTTPPRPTACGSPTGSTPGRAGDYSGDMLVSVERKTGEGMITYGGPGAPGPAAVGGLELPDPRGLDRRPVGGARSGLILGLAPLLLAFTGLSTWLYKRRLRKRRRAWAAASPGVSEATLPRRDVYSRSWPCSPCWQPSGFAAVPPYGRA